jgi:hypothetical protein
VETHPVKSDAVILLLCPDYKAREEEAYRLIRDGYTNTLIIPAQKKIFNITIKGDGSLLQQSIGNKNSLTPKREGNQSHRFYENTHLELMAGKSMLDSLGFTSAIFVSSPYHLRRIKKIADRVFTGKSYGLSFASPRFQKKEKTLWGINKNDLKMIVSEYVKIVWLLIYQPFCK